MLNKYPPQYILEHLDTALSNGQIKVYYQPIIHVVSGRLCGYEGLARWEVPEGFISPGDFIPVLEQAGRIHDVDIYMIRKACADMRRYAVQNWTIVPISLNLSVYDFEAADMPAVAEEAIDRNGLPSDFLAIEVRESSLGLGQKVTLDALQRFRQMGFELWLDNFGSEHSSLNILRELEIDLLKIDMSFLKDFHTNRRSRSILKNIIHMAKDLGLRTLMMGVEDQEVLDFLRQTGCEKAQGYLFGNVAPATHLNHRRLNPESLAMRQYCNAIGRVNLLSQTPLKTGWFDDAGDVLFGTLPLAVTEFDGTDFHFLMSNRYFCETFKPLNMNDSSDPEQVFNNRTLQFAIQICNTAQMCLNSDQPMAQDFVTSEGFHVIRLRRIALNAETGVGAILIVVEKISDNKTLAREDYKKTALPFLYTLYSRVDLIKKDGTNVTNIFLNSSRYRESFVEGSVQRSIQNFAYGNIYSGDRKKFLAFFDLETIDERLAEVGGSHVTDYFRTRDDNQNYSWQMYILIPIVLKGEAYLLCGARGIDAERMRRLPEIDRMGMAYYDMPGNPIFLLLASRAFSSIMGYGSFEKFLRNSFFVEANLSNNRVIDMHLGKQGILSKDKAMSWTYDEAIGDMILNTVLYEEHDAVSSFFDRTRLLADYQEGKVKGEMEFLRRPDDDSKPRYLHTCYQLRESGETDDIHVFFLSFDIDAYRRTGEAMTELIERDRMTGLYKRETAVSAIADYIVKEKDKQAALVILDLDNFKQINDRFGHDCGDTLIKDGANRLKNVFANKGLVARIGGDEFMAFLKGISEDETNQLLQQFSAVIKSIDYKGQYINYTMSIGFAMYPQQSDSFNNLYQKADMALYSVKMSGRNSARQFSRDMETTNRDRLGFSIAQISEGMPGGFLVYRNNNKQEIIYVNKRLMQIFECNTLEEFLNFTGGSFRGCVLPDDWDKVQNIVNTQTNQFHDYDYLRYRAQTAQGHIRVLENFGRMVKSPIDGDIFYVFIIDWEQKQEILNAHSEEQAN